MTKRVGLVGVAAAMTFSLVACGSSDDDSRGQTSAKEASSGTVLVYSGRDEDLVDPLIEQLQGTLGFKVEVDYSGNTNAQAAKILEEGDKSPADVFFGQDAGALGVLDAGGALAKLPDDILTMVPEQFRSSDGTWVATSARQRVLVYNDTKVTAGDLPTGIDGLLDPRWRGQIGYAPTNASFQAFVTALRVDRGDDAARKWLTEFKANDPVAFEGNGALMTAINDGQVSAGLTNHYYYYPFVEEKGGNAPIAIHRFAAGDPGALINVAGAGVISHSNNKEESFKFIRSLLSKEAQTYFANETAEYPVISGVTSTYDLPALSNAGGLDINLNDLASLKETQAMLTQVGMV